MGKPITVKVSTPKVIKALEARLQKLEEDYASQERYEAEYQKQLEQWRKELTKFAMTKFADAENIRTNYREWNKTLNVEFDITAKGTDFPKEPERGFDQIYSHTYKEMKEDIVNALNILKMTDEETVNASTMKSIARYL